MTICRECRAENRAEARFCDSCGERLAVAAEERRKTVTILFCDVSGSTALGEHLDPESLHRVMSRYFAVAAKVIEHHGGTVEKFIGDAVMAVFGVPVLHEDDAIRAVRAAVDLRGSVDGLNAELERDYGVAIEIRIGVNTGEVVSGGGDRLAAGDAVNVASRLESSAGPGEILIGPETFQLVQSSIRVSPVEHLVVKGKSDAIAAFRLLGIDADAPTVTRRTDVPMVGRTRELDQLNNTLERTVENRTCQLCTILGGAGVGKSRLVHEFLDNVPGAQVLTGLCLSYGEGITYWPLIAILRQLAAPLETVVGDNRARDVLRSLTGSVSTACTTEEIAWAFRTLLERLAERGPIVCIFDDVHWGEPPLLDLIEHVAEL